MTGSAAEQTAGPAAGRPSTFDLGGFRVDRDGRIVFGPQGETHLEPKVMSVLALLVGRAGEVVTRDAFIEAVWPREFGGDEGLTRAVSQLRKVLETDPEQRVTIETIPRTGYRLRVHQEEASSIDARPQTAGDGAQASPLGSRWLALAAALLVVVVIALAIRGTQQSSAPGADRLARVPLAPSEITLAVLPFQTPGGTAEDAALALGLSDEILEALSRSLFLSVIGGSSASRMVGEDPPDPVTLGRQFGVSHVMEGSVVRTGGELYVTVSLRETASDREVWSEELRRPDANTWTIPGFLASAVHAALGAGRLERSSGALPPDPSAYESYLQARALMRGGSGENLATAIRLLENAVGTDPALAQAWSALAWARLDRANVETSTDIGREDTLDNWQAARLAANRALALDPTSIDALLVLIAIDMMEREDTLVETEGRVRSLLERAPNHPNANHRLAVQLMSVGRWEESLRYSGRALQLDPLSGLVGFYHATALLGSKRYDGFLSMLRRANAEAGWRRSWPWLVYQLNAKDYAQARDFFSILEEDPVFYLGGLGLPETVDPDTPRGAALLDLVDRLVSAAELGDRSTDLAIAADLLAAAESGLIPDHWVAQLLGAAGLDEAAFQLARERIARGEVWYRELLMLPAFESLRRDPAVMELFAASGQLDYWRQTGRWPDYCADPELPYDCESAGRAVP